MSHDTVVSRAFEGSFRKKRERRTGKEEGRCRTVGGLEKVKDVVRTVLQSGPLRLRAVIVVTLCLLGNVMDMYLCSWALSSATGQEQ